ncbi:hypothetical protein MHYP_G00275180, partial [Metynnis hypsauchen]
MGGRGLSVDKQACIQCVKSMESVRTGSVCVTLAGKENTARS